MTQAIIYKPIDDLIPYVNNSRLHSTDQIAQLAASIAEFGFTNPILIDNKNGIIAGHGRVKAAKKVGIEEVPCVTLDLTDTGKRAYIIADNNLALNAEWDHDILEVELDRLESEGFDLDLIGFDELELAEEEQALDTENPYTMKIEAPIYEPTGEKPQTTDLCDTTRTDILISEINAAEIPEELKIFLRSAAERHTKFDYSKIAEYFAHSSKTVQELMENSALVIIDHNKAIELGFMKLSQDIEDHFYDNE